MGGGGKEDNMSQMKEQEKFPEKKTRCNRGKHAKDEVQNNGY